MFIRRATVRKLRLFLPLILFAMAVVLPVSWADSATQKVEWHQIAVCDVEPNQVEIQGHNVNKVSIKITGEIYARPDGGSAVLISAVPEPYQTVTPDNYGGPEERIVNRFPQGFVGVVYGK